MDYMYLSDSKEDNNPILVIHGTDSEGVWAVMGRRKGDDEYIVRRRIIKITCRRSARASPAR